MGSVVPHQCFFFLIFLFCFFFVSLEPPLALGLGVPERASAEALCPGPQSPRPLWPGAVAEPCSAPAQTAYIWSCVPPPAQTHIWSPKPASRLNTEHLGPKEPAPRLTRPIWASGCCSTLSPQWNAGCTSGRLQPCSPSVLPVPGRSRVHAAWGFLPEVGVLCTRGSLFLSWMTQLMGLLLGVALGIA